MIKQLANSDNLHSEFNVQFLSKESVILFRVWDIKTWFRVQNYSELDFFAPDITSGIEHQLKHNIFVPNTGSMIANAIIYSSKTHYLKDD